MGRVWFSALILTATIGFGRAAPAQEGGDGRREFEQVEEQMLRDQIERFLNEGARWDAERRRIVFKKGAAEGLAGMEAPLTAVLGRLAVPDDGGRLRLKEGVKLRPFAMVIRDYFAEGGLDDIERFRRMREEGRAENPFPDGVPPRVMKAVAGLMKALNDQDMRGLASDDGDREDAERDDRRERGRDGAGERREGRRGEARERGSSWQDRITERLLEVDPEELAERLKAASDLARQAERDIARLREELDRRLDELGWKDRADELRAGAEERLRRFAESDGVKRAVERAEQRLMDFLTSDEGRDLERRFFEFLESDRGRDLARRAEEFLRSEEGRAAAGRLAELFERLRRGGDGGGRGGARDREAPASGSRDEAKKKDAPRTEKKQDEPRKKDEPRKGKDQGRKLF